MTPLLQTVLTLMLLLQVKHLFADFFMQTARMLSARDVYFHLGRLQHAGLHAGLSATVFLAIGSPLGFVVWLCALEWIVHFHIDFGKGRYSVKVGHGPADAGYWRAFGFDQFLHQLTYVGMIWAWAVFAAA